MHPIAFVESLEALDWGMWRADDPDTHAEAVERHRLRHSTLGDEHHVHPLRQGIEHVRRPADDRRRRSPVRRRNCVQYPYCDHRPLYHLGSNGPDPVKHDSYNGPFYGVVTDSGAGEDIYGMVWNEVYLDNTSNPYQPAYDAIQANAKAVILDHRLGNGGDVQGAQFLTSIFRPAATIASWAGFNQTIGEFDACTMSFGLNLYQTSLASGAYDVGSSSANTKLPAALMIARDGSASDWFPLGMRNGSPNIRVFGRHTAGAFSSYFVFDYYSSMSWRMASGDLIMPDGSDAPRRWRPSRRRDRPASIRSARGRRHGLRARSRLGANVHDVPPMKSRRSLFARRRDAMQRDRPRSQPTAAANERRGHPRARPSAAQRVSSQPVRRRVPIGQL